MQFVAAQRFVDSMITSEQHNIAKSRMLSLIQQILQVDDEHEHER